ncbi:hypothetical protein PPACK8108_LOCUS16866 [Phakopsora pachyrhizi]|uniref:Uncharacterized protein n=1 Tax=Phakopsora pachyrhizi TaxID=170000 RepID=A0AAV0B877_PHAPC|nr:hypothetical protein PPACK8108_LOCUS16866 [Phakopsora pachyrhizi]
MNSDNPINHSTIITKGTTLGTCLGRMSTSGKIKSALAAYKGNGVIDSTVVLRQQQSQQIFIQPINLPSRSLFKLQKPSENIQQRAYLKSRDDCSSPLSSLKYRHSQTIPSNPYSCQPDSIRFP